MHYLEHPREGCPIHLPKSSAKWQVKGKTQVLTHHIHPHERDTMNERSSPSPLMVWLGEFPFCSNQQDCNIDPEMSRGRFSMGHEPAFVLCPPSKKGPQKEGGRWHPQKVSEGRNKKQKRRGEKNTRTKKKEEKNTEHRSHRPHSTDSCHPPIDSLLAVQVPGALLQRRQKPQRSPTAMGSDESIRLAGIRTGPQAGKWCVQAKSLNGMT